MAVTKKSSTAPVKKIKVDNSSAAKAERKEQKVKRKSKLSQIRQKARQDYKSLTPKEKQHLAERNIFTQAIRHGASESDAKAEVAKYRARIKMKQSGKHATAARKALHDGSREIRTKLKSELTSAKDALKKAREHNKSIKDPKARANANVKAKEAYQNAAKKIASARVKAVEGKKNKLKDIHEKMQTLKKVFKKPVAAKGVRLVSAEAKPAAAAPAGKTPKAAKTPKHKESAAERKERKAAEKAPGYGPQITKNRLTRRNNEAAKKAAEAPAPKSKKAPKAPKADAKPAAAAPAAKEPKAPKVKVAGKRASRMGPNDGPQISKNRLTRRNNEAAKKAAEAPAPKPAKAAKKPRAKKADGSANPKMGPNDGPQISKNRLTRRNNEAAKAPAAKPAKAPKAPKASTKPAAATPAAKPAKKPKASKPAAATPAPAAKTGGIKRR